MTTQIDATGTGIDVTPVPADITKAEQLLQQADTIADPLSSAVKTFRAFAHLALFMVKEEAGVDTEPSSTGE